MPSSPLGLALGSSESIQVLPTGDLLVADEGFPFGCSEWFHFGPTSLKPISISPFAPPTCSGCSVVDGVTKVTPHGCCTLVLGVVV